VELDEAALKRCAFPLFSPCLLALLLINVAGPAHGLVIQATFDSSITSDPNAATIESTINAAIAVYEAKFSDPITVTIKFQEMTTGLGHSSWWYYEIPYRQFYTNLLADAKSSNDSIALAHLPASANNPVTGTNTIRVKTANLRAIGISGMNSGLEGGVDGIIGLNTAIMNLSRPPANLSKYDLMAVAEHEINEVLGLASALPGVTPPLPEDLFRYDSSGSRTFTTSGDNARFSIDGTTFLARFNQNSSGDYGDWWTAGAHTPQVQDAFLTAGATPDLGVEVTALDVIGYDPSPRLAMTHGGAGQVIISWTPATPGFVLQQCTNLVTGLWINSITGSTNPVTVSATSVPGKYYRVKHP